MKSPELKVEPIFWLLIIFLALLAFIIDPPESTPVSSLRVEGGGETTEWIGEDGRTYIVRWGNGEG